MAYAGGVLFLIEDMEKATTQLLLVCNPPNVPFRGGVSENPTPEFGTKYETRHFVRAQFNQ